jgi:serine/threonine protein phosphatase PrpC
MKQFQLAVRACGQTDVGRVRPHNEDAFVVADLTNGSAHGGSGAAEIPVGVRGVLLAVSDGMGGAEAGEVASALVVESLRESLDDTCKESDILLSIKCAVEEANRDVWEAAHESGHRGMGATLTAVIVHRALAHIASVGDSRAYLIRGGHISRVTKDQSYVEVLIDAGVISREEAETSPYKNVILQAMGVKPEVEIGLARLQMRNGDVFLLCSDGLWEKVAEEELLAVVSSESLEGACARLIALANERGGEDNITVVLGVVSGGGLDAPRPGETATGTLERVAD